MCYDGCTFPSAILKGVPIMTVIPSVRVSQPHIEQIHNYLEEAVKELAFLRQDAAKRGASDVVRRLDSLEYYIVTARQSLPPRQTKLPF